MYMSERQVVSITEANQNFSAVARKVDERMTATSGLACT